MRTPWQSFRLDLERAPVRLWSALGRLEAYGETLTSLPAAPGAAAALTRDWRGRAAQATLAAEAAEGTAALEPEVAEVLAALYDEIDRHGQAGAALTPQTLCADNATLTEYARAAGLFGQEDADAGTASLADQFAEGPGSWARLNQFCTWLNGPEFEAREGEAVQTAMLRALGAHLFLLRLGPFRHCNEATARVAGYRLLRAAGLPAMAAHLPAAHFAATPERYGELIAEAAESGGATFAFIAYAVDGIADGMRRQIAVARRSAAGQCLARYGGPGLRRADARRRRPPPHAGRSARPRRRAGPHRPAPLPDAQARRGLRPQKRQDAVARRQMAGGRRAGAAHAARGEGAPRGR